MRPIWQILHFFSMLIIVPMTLVAIIGAYPLLIDPWLIDTSKSLEGETIFIYVVYIIAMIILVPLSRIFKEASKKE